MDKEFKDFLDKMDTELDRIGAMLDIILNGEKDILLKINETIESIEKNKESKPNT